MTTLTPKGYGSVTPRLFAFDDAGLVSFLKTVFDARGELRPGVPAEMTIGDSMVLVSDGGGVRAPGAAFLYVYVRDADETYQRALAAGAAPIEAPTDMPYGDRRATVRDPYGNTWQIATLRAKG